MKLVHLVGFIIKIFVTMHGHMNKKAIIFLTHAQIRRFKIKYSNNFTFLASTFFKKKYNKMYLVLEMELTCVKRW